MATAIQSQPQRAHDPHGSTDAIWWTVTTAGSTVGEHERQHYKDARSAFDEFGRRIHELELAGFRQDGEETAEYGRRWSRDYVRGEEHVTVRVDRPHS